MTRTKIHPRTQVLMNTALLFETLSAHPGAGEYFMFLYMPERVGRATAVGRFGRADLVTWSADQSIAPGGVRRQIIMDAPGQNRTGDSGLVGRAPRAN